MKKTLAAVLAAAMALSTASVVFARDSQDIDVVFGGDTGDGSTTKKVEDGVKMGDNSKFAIGDISGFTDADGNSNSKIEASDLSALIEEGIIKPTVVVTSGKPNLASSPVIKTNDNNPVLQFKINHTYGTSSSKVGMKIRFTVAKTFYIKDAADTTSKVVGGNFTTTEKYKDASKKEQTNKAFLKKGDTLIGPEVTYEASYREIDYGKEMTVTVQEVKDNYVLAKGDELYAHAGSDDKVSIYFDNYAAVDFKVSPAQKDLNLYYAIGEIDEVPELAQLANEYRDVDFEFITFKGKRASTTLTNSGEMTFNAIGGANTQIYFLESASGGDDATFIPWEDLGKVSHDKTLGTVTISGVKRLSGSFVVASEMLEVKGDEEDYEPVSSAPVVEEPSSSEAPSTTPDRNPSTGAC